MDIGKRDSRCNPRARPGMEITGNFSEQFSDSSSNHGDIARIQSSNKAANSPCDEEKTPTFPKAEVAGREGDLDSLGNSNGSSTAMAASPTSKKPLPKQTGSSLSKAKQTNLSSSSVSGIRDEKDIKKEDTSLSPQNISPLGFGSNVVGQPPARDNEDNNGNKTSNLSPTTSDKNTAFSRSTCNDMEERSASASLALTGNTSSNVDTNCGGVLGNSLSPKCKTEPDFNTNMPNMTNMPRNISSFNGNMSKFNCSTTGNDSGISLNSVGGGGGNSGNDYMQQQNHVFVFSTQLANKSAEAVLCGQFPTIIAYHCMQPTTKLFLEDFLKNPAKTTKLQRQYSLNIMNVMQSGSSGPGGGQPPYWLNECQNSNRLVSQRLPMRNVVGGGAGGVGKNNAGWDSTVLENQSCGTVSSLDAINNADIGGKGDDKSNIPSLQGVKVPDENLTPQQRQHREEQLAKIKKINKLFFPENEGNDFHGPPNHSNASNTSEAPTNPADMLHNSSSHCPDGGANKICPPAMRNMGGNMTKPGQPNMDAMATMAGGDAIMPSDMMNSSGDGPNMGLMQNMKHGGCLNKMNPSSVGNLNAVKSGRQCDMGNDPSGGGMENNADLSASGNFNMNNCGPTDGDNVGNLPSDIMMSQPEWSKFQNSGFPDGFKGGRQMNAVNPANFGPGGNMGCQQNASLSRSLSTGVTGYGGMQPRPNTGPSASNRNNTGPPPPYHQTQRSASVPIATQSPTHASPNKPTADMPLPSPQASSRVHFGVSPTPQSSDIANPPSSACSTYPGPTSANVNSSMNQHSSSILNNMSTNSPAPLSHISPRELDCMEPGGHKSKMSSPQKFKGGPGPGLINDVSEMEAKYGNLVMGYPTCNMPPQSMRQNMQQMPPQFCRRIDNIPLNPNCNRVGPSKNASNFDPISSLTQMSQQLTGVGLSSIGGGSSGPGGIGVMDLNPGDLMSGGPSMRGSGDPSLDHCQQMSNANNMGMVGGLAGALGRVTGQFGPDMNNMLCGDNGPMDQRMLNGKMCVPNMPGGFGPNSALTGVGLRESAVGCNDMPGSNRQMNRRGMPNNFDNFSMSPNIHVKVSAPNTIQYMPARSQNMNNMRVPPSIEFFQRYSNPQVMGGMGGGVGHPSNGPMPNDLVNPNVMNMFGNCNQIPGGVAGMGGNGNGGFEQNELEVEGNVLPNNDYMNVPQ